jgi:hypothetical protein
MSPVAGNSSPQNALQEEPVRFQKKYKNRIVLRNEVDTKSESVEIKFEI